MSLILLSPIVVLSSFVSIHKLQHFPYFSSKNSFFPLLKLKVHKSVQTLRKCLGSQGISVRKYQGESEWQEAKLVSKSFLRFSYLSIPSVSALNIQSNVSDFLSLPPCLNSIQIISFQLFSLSHSLSLSLFDRISPLHSSTSVNLTFFLFPFVINVCSFFFVSEIRHSFMSSFFPRCFFSPCNFFLHLCSIYLLSL